MKIAGPNGLVIDVPESIATAMVGDGSGDHRFVPDDEAPKRPVRQRKTQSQ